MYFSIYYKFVFVCEASLSSREVGGVGSQQGRSSSQHFQGGEDASQPR